MCVARHAQVTQNNKFAISWCYFAIFCTEISIKTCYKLMLWFWWGWSTLKFFLTLTFTSEEHSQSTQNSKFATNLYNISKKVRNGVHFEHADKHWSFYKLALLVLREVARQKYHNYFCVLLWCKASRYFARVQSCLLFLVFGWLQSKMGAAF